MNCLLGCIDTVRPIQTLTLFALARPLWETAHRSATGFALFSGIDSYRIPDGGVVAHQSDPTGICVEHVRLLAVPLKVASAVSMPRYIPTKMQMVLSCGTIQRFSSSSKKYVRGNTVINLFLVLPNPTGFSPMSAAKTAHSVDSGMQVELGHGLASRQ